MQLGSMFIKIIIKKILGNAFLKFWQKLKKLDGPWDPTPLDACMEMGGRLIRSTPPANLAKEGRQIAEVSTH
jgi:hypothetical protein